MRQAKTWILSLLGLGIVAAVLFPVVARGKSEAERRSREPAFLKRQFAEVRPHGDGVLLTPARYASLRTSDGLPVNKPRAFPADVRLGVGSGHSRREYRVARQESHGIVLRDGVGQDILLAWK